MTRHMFASGNTPIGFVNFFDYILPLENAEKRYFLKGSSGSGKSTFMKKVAKHLGGDCEFFYCSGDPESLDGIHNKKAKIAVFDGTAPHTIDPLYPAVCDQILNLGMFISGEKLRRYAGKIIKNTDKKAEYYYNAYQYLAAAQKLDKIIYRSDLSGASCERAEGVLEQFTLTGGGGNLRKLFLQAVTPLGIIDFREQNFKNRLYMDFASLAERNLALSEVSAGLLKKGYDIDAFYNPLYPKDLESLYVKNTDILIMQGNGLQKRKNQKLTERLIALATDELYKARACHKENEKYYMESMDFEALEDYTSIFIESLIK